MLHSSALHDRVKNQRSQCFEGSTQVCQPTKVSRVYAHILGFNISLVKLEPGAQRENLAVGPTSTGFKADTTFLNDRITDITLKLDILDLLLTVLGFLAFCCQVSM